MFTRDILLYVIKYINHEMLLVHTSLRMPYEYLILIMKYLRYFDGPYHFQMFSVRAFVGNIRCFSQILRESIYAKHSAEDSSTRTRRYINFAR